MAVLVDRVVIVSAHYNRLLQAFRPLVRGLTARYFTEELIDVGSASAASSNIQPEEDKTRALLAAILGKIRTDGDQFEVLVRVMREFPKLVSLADDMEAALKIEEESSTRNVIVIQPPFHRSMSDVSNTSLGEGSKASSNEMLSVREDLDNVSLDGLEEVLSDNQYDVLVKDTKPVSETLAPPNIDARSVAVLEPGLDRPFISPSASKAFTYDVWKAPLDGELYERTPNADATATSHQEVNLRYKFHRRKLEGTDERTTAGWQDVVKKLNTQPGLILNKKDDQIVTLKKKFKSTGSEIEDLIETEEKTRREEEQLKAQMTSEEDKQSKFEKLQNEHRKQLDKIHSKIDDYHKMLHEILDFQVESKQLYERLLNFLEAKPEYVQKVDIFTDAPSCDAQHVLRALIPIADKWKTVGTLLGVEPTQLNKIDHSLSHDEDKLREMTYIWVKLESASWESLVTAVEPVDQIKADEIKKDFVVRFPVSETNSGN